jgi:hypothetical protein
MNDPYDDEDDEYDDDYHNYDYGDQYDPYKFYFKFDVSADNPLSKWLTDIFDNIDYWNQIQSIVAGFPVFSVPVNSWNPNTGDKDKLQYLGSNYANEPIWKTKYWAIDPINSQYKSHIQSHAVHFISQPKYYKGLFDILN